MKKLIMSAIFTGLLLSTMLPVFAEEETSESVTEEYLYYATDDGVDYTVVIPSALTLNLNNMDEEHLSEGKFGLVELNPQDENWKIVFRINHPDELNHENSTDSIVVYFEERVYEDETHPFECLENREKEYDFSDDKTYNLIRMRVPDNFDTKEHLAGTYSGKLIFEVWLEEDTE